MKTISVIVTCSLLCIAENAIAQRQIVQQIIEENIYENPYEGHYHEFISDVGSPIENIMAEAKFCEIEDKYLLIPCLSSELIEEGYLPVKELANESIYYLLEDDVLGYFEDLKEEYNTPLKAKRFKESQEYKNYKRQHFQDKIKILENTFYSIRTLSEFETFDLNNQSFKIQLPNVFIGYDIHLDTKDNHFYTSDFVTPEIDEDTAFKIESNPCEIIVFVKFTGKTRIHGVSKQAICEPTKVYIANKNTGDIYFEYTPYKELLNPITKVENKTVSQTKPTEVSHADKVYDTHAVETTPKFPGGDAALIKFISENLKYPEEAAKQDIQGNVHVQFVVCKDGLLRDVRIIRSVSPELDKEAIKVFNHPKMPKWEPGRVNGMPVNVTYTFPIRFRLRN